MTGSKTAVDHISKLVSLFTSPLVIPLSVGLCFTILLLFVHFYVSRVISSFSLLRYLPSSSLHLSALPSYYCATVGWGCNASTRRGSKADVARIARSVAEQAHTAHDIFQSISALGDPAMVPGLHFVELWELAVAVSASSNLPSKDDLGDSLKELGDLTRDMSDRLVDIHAQGINSL